MDKIVNHVLVFTSNKSLHERFKPKFQRSAFVLNDDGTIQWEIKDGGTLSVMETGANHIEQRQSVRRPVSMTVSPPENETGANYKKHCACFTRKSLSPLTPKPEDKFVANYYQPCQFVGIPVSPMYRPPEKETGTSYNKYCQCDRRPVFPITPPPEKETIINNQQFHPVKRSFSPIRTPSEKETQYTDDKKLALKFRSRRFNSKLPKLVLRYGKYSVIGKRYNGCKRKLTKKGDFSPNTLPEYYYNRPFPRKWRRNYVSKAQLDDEIDKYMAEISRITTSVTKEEHDMSLNERYLNEAEHYLKKYKTF